MAFQSQANGLVAFKAQSALGTAAAGSSGFVLRTAGGQGGRISKATYRSEEVRRDLMRTRGRHGLQRTAGTYLCEVSLDNCDAFYEAFFRGTWEAALAIDENDVTSMAVDSSGTITAASGSWITLGLRVGDIVVMTNNSAAGNNSRNLRVTAVTASVLTVVPVDGVALTTASADTSCTLTRVGQKLINPAEGAAVKTYFTIEEYDGDLDLTEIFEDCIITGLRFSMGSSGLLMCEISWVGTGVFSTASGGSAPTFTSPTESTGLPLAVVDAVLRLGSTDRVDLTSFELNMQIGGVAPEVIGAVTSPDVFTGAMGVSMSFGMLRQDYGRMTEFLDETALTFHVVAEENEADPKDFLSLFVPNFTLGGVDKSALSIEAGPRTQTINVPEELVGKDVTGGAYDATMVKLQVSNT